MKENKGTGNLEVPIKLSSRKGEPGNNPKIPVWFTSIITLNILTRDRWYYMPALLHWAMKETTFFFGIIFIFIDFSHTTALHN